MDTKRASASPSTLFYKLASATRSKLGGRLRRARSSSSLQPPMRASQHSSALPMSVSVLQPQDSRRKLSLDADRLLLDHISPAVRVSSQPKQPKQQQQQQQQQQSNNDHVSSRRPPVHSSVDPVERVKPVQAPASDTSRARQAPLLAHPPQRNSSLLNGSITRVPSLYRPPDPRPPRSSDAPPSDARPAASSSTATLDTPPPKRRHETPANPGPTGSSDRGPSSAPDLPPSVPSQSSDLPSRPSESAGSSNPFKAQLVASALPIPPSTTSEPQTHARPLIADPNLTRQGPSAWHSAEYAPSASITSRLAEQPSSDARDKVLGAEPPARAGTLQSAVVCHIADRRAAL
jgi:hypothetical protein